MTEQRTSFLLVGESDVGKTHYGAQLLRRLNSNTHNVSLVDSENLKPFRETMDQLSRGLAGGHTPRGESSISNWVVHDTQTEKSFELAWPDYAGEQITTLINTRSLPTAWKDRVVESDAWAFMVRPSRVRLPPDVLTRQVRLETEATEKEGEQPALSPQSRLIEVLQMLRYKYAAHREDWASSPPICLMLSCWDELNTELSPTEYCKQHLPLLFAYLMSNWPPSKFSVFGVAPVGQTLSDTQPNDEIVKVGPEKLGFVVLEDGEKSDDLFAPIRWMLGAVEIG